MIGKTLGHYRIIEKIGAGGMGEVYRARDERLERDVALKVLPAGALADEAARKRFRKEALALSKLNHPNIETVYDFDTQDGVDFLVMEHIAGETLDAKVKQGALGEKEVARLGAQLAEGLAAAHAAGVVHRDLKPGNLRVTPDGRLKILDFGLAKLLRPAVDPASAATAESLTETQAVAGTLPYMAPEQLRGETVDARTDLWAAGAVLYEMAAGRRPFEAKLATALTDDILHKPPPSPGRLNPDLSSRLEEITLRCLEKDPEHRYQSARDLLADFRRLSAPPAPAAPATLAAKPSVAVLPFQNLSPDPENEYFSDGVTEEIISKLSRIQQLQVASRTSVARFKGTQKDIKEVGQELGVRYVLEGSVRKAGNRVRITAQLIDTSTGFHLWAEDFQGELKDVFAVQEQTALKIAAALNLRLSPQEQQAVQRRTTDNPKAYDAYLRGRALAEHADNREKLEAARRQFEQALEADSDYAPALAGLSLVESAYYRNLDRSEARRQLAEQLARRALALDPDLPEAHFAFGYVHGEPPVMRRSAQIGRFAATLALGLAAAEVVIMISPFAGLFYGSLRFEPFLGFFSQSALTAWLDGFFLNHAVVTNSALLEWQRKIGLFLFALGLWGFFLSGFQVYGNKILKRGVAKGLLYRFVRHPQYLCLGIAGWGLLTWWPRFLLLGIWVTMLFLYAGLARFEERRLEEQFGEDYRRFGASRGAFLPRSPMRRLFEATFGRLRARPLGWAAAYVFCLTLAFSLGFALRAYTRASTTILFQPEQQTVIVSTWPQPEEWAAKVFQAALTDEQVQERLEEARGNQPVVATILPAQYVMTGMYYKEGWGLRGEGGTAPGPSQLTMAGFSFTRLMRIASFFLVPIEGVTYPEHFWGVDPDVSNDPVEVVFSRAAKPYKDDLALEEALDPGVRLTPLVIVDVLPATGEVTRVRVPLPQNAWGPNVVMPLL